ncbi:MAG: sigma-54 dependent transcriptional regulator [Sphaerochaetaceae bacterium]|jgi:DNA-binding NtrC family response regulator|nr:sigma-54 dependent transcriptional regulator [Sphaerochaetaceae bacterium]MDD4841397.1 sigma-54 dependent transcriptional regulator [Sphaerochaetaceae bacterium]MDX9935099.1 sigma-54 dependent transcriptional regulator [Sphaerochaetaceae bacterium]NLO61264.1 sigma-54-dependent Fis family transcriptional regulator [Spirochaetales bacterium]
MKRTILVADDEKNIRNGLQIALEDEGYEVLLAADGNEAWKLLVSSNIDLVVSDLRMPGLSGQDLLKKVVSSFPMMPVIILTGHGTIESAVEAMRNGAVDFVTKPLNLDRLFLMIRRALTNRELYDQNEALKKELEQLKRETGSDKIIGKSEKMVRLMDRIRQVADAQASVLITGESGVGKELVADALHHFSSRATGPFIKVSCASFAETLLEDELFGHEKGAFSGAVSSRKGRFELADGGTLFLDEIGEINQSTQVKLLRVLQERSFERLGGEKTLQVDVRLVAATNRNLKDEVDRGRFREDLYYRLNVVHLDVPPLRERKEDIPLLIAHFLQTYNERNKRSVEGFTSRAKAAMLNYDWPGNIRELGNCVESTVVLATDKTIHLEDLPAAIRNAGSEERLTIPVGTTMAQAEKEIILATIAHCGGNKSKAAEVLGLARKTLHRKLQEYQLATE